MLLASQQEPVNTSHPTPYSLANLGALTWCQCACLLVRADHTPPDRLINQGA